MTDLTHPNPAAPDDGHPADALEAALAFLVDCGSTWPERGDA